MNEPYADYVYPILTRGLEIKERVARGEDLDLTGVQRDFIQHLERPVDDALRGDIQGDAQGWQGLRYALTCWLDEIFIEKDCPPEQESRWSRAWRGNLLEFALFRRAVGGAQFPVQSELALRTRNSDVVETFFLCWMLGFRGTLREDVASLSQDHIEPARRTISRALNKDFEAPPKREPRSFVPPLKGRGRMHRMILAWILIFFPLAIAIVVAFLQRGQ
jgi:type IV/VI secretion system ImpK/VasF family protein